MKRKNIPKINFLRKHREIKGYTLKQVAFLLGYESIGVISSWEQGRRIPSFINILRLSTIYRTLPHRLYTDLAIFIQEEIGVNERVMRGMDMSLLSD